MNIYQPTWLMIKQHNQTGLKYFCKTTRKDPIKYLGSGKYWKRHLAVHGKDVSTIWCHQYDNEELLKEEALAFSASHDIVESPNWANLKPETGVDGGGVIGRIVRSDTKQKISAARLGTKRNPSTGQKISNILTGRVNGPMPAERRLAISMAKKGRSNGHEGLTYSKIKK
jgi:hypothetical protein